MVLDELLPLLEEKGHDTTRVGWLGWSMGGYGSLRLAALRGSAATSAVAVASPALWSDPADASVDGFSDPADYRESSVFDRQDDLAGIPVRIDIGRGDPFYLDVEEYAEGLGAGGELHLERGGHTPGYWRRMLPAQLGFLGSYV
jgi:pimeloyl-ACP methyl ester carboxylesterase